MKINISQRDLKNALSIVGGFLPAKPVINILKCIKFTTKDNRIKLEAFNGEAGVKTYIAANEIDADGEFALDGADFTKFIGSLPDSDITLTIEGNEIEIKHSKGKFTLPTFDAAEYPKFETPEAEQTIEIPTSILAEAINVGSKFVSTDTLRPMMQCVYAYVKEGKFGYAATDTRVLVHDFDAVLSLPQELTLNFYVEPVLFKPLLKVCSVGGTVTINITSKAVSYRVGNTIMQAPQTKGNFPPFERVIPSTFTGEIITDMADMKAALNRLSLVDNKTSLIKLTADPMQLQIVAEDSNYQRSAAEYLTHEGGVDSFVIGLSSTKLATVLSVADAEKCIMAFNDASRPVVLRNASRPNRVAMLMPMTLNS